MTVSESSSCPSTNNPLTSPLPGEQLMCRLMGAFQQRYDDILDVIDDALDSEVMKERIWAVEQILKRCKLPEAKADPMVKKERPKRGKTHSTAQQEAQQQLNQMTPEELWRELDQLFRQVQHATEENQDTQSGESTP